MSLHISNVISLQMPDEIKVTAAAVPEEDTTVTENAIFMIIDLNDATERETVDEITAKEIHSNSITNALVDLDIEVPIGVHNKYRNITLVC